MILSLADGNISYVDRGESSATPIIFLHGFPFDHTMWDLQLEVVSRHYRAIAYDVRGHGDSTVGDGQFTIEQHVDDLIALLDHLKIHKVVIVGLSMGGYIALRALERNPERFTGAVLCDTRSEADSNEGKIGRAGAMREVKKNGSIPFADGFVKKIFAEQTFERNKEAVESIRSVIAHTPPLSIAGTLLALAARTDTTPSLSAIKVPVLILVGKEDALTPPSAAQALQERIAGSELHIVPQAGHMSNLENPEFFNEKLLYFLKRVAAT